MRHKNSSEQCVPFCGCLQKLEFSNLHAIWFERDDLDLNKLFYPPSVDNELEIPCSTVIGMDLPAEPEARTRVELLGQTQGALQSLGQGWKTLTCWDGMYSWPSYLS